MTDPASKEEGAYLFVSHSLLRPGPLRYDDRYVLAVNNLGFPMGISLKIDNHKKAIK